MFVAVSFIGFQWTFRQTDLNKNILRLIQTDNLIKNLLLVMI